MALSWNEIKDRALKFSNEWAEETKERAEKDSFWNDFFNVFGRNVEVFCNQIVEGVGIDFTYCVLQGGEVCL